MRSAPSEEKTGWKSVRYPAAFLILTALAIALQLQYRGFEGPLSDNLLIIILINANFLLLAAVVVMMAKSLWKLWVERKQGVLGAKFRTRLVVAFVSLSFIPPVLLFLIGSGMFTRSIERLFSLRIENTLKDSVSVAQEYYDRMEREARAFGALISSQMSNAELIDQFDRQSLKEYLQRRADEFGLGSIELFASPRERTLFVVTGQYPPKTFTQTESGLVEQGFFGRTVADLSGIGRKGDILRAIVPVWGARGPEEEKHVVSVLAVSFYIPQNLAAKTDEIRAGYAQYRSAFTGKEPIKFSYRLGFLAVTLALLLAAIWVALRVADSITVPIRKLAEGTAAVAAGRFDYRIDERSGDEVGVLIDSFNRMTHDLQQSRELVEQEVNYKKTILSNIDTGVVSLDRTGRITTVNKAAAEILSIQEQDVLGKRYDEAFAFIEFAPIRALFRTVERGQGRMEAELPVKVRGRILTLRVRISTLLDSSGAPIGSVITFDDLTELFRAKNAETWQDMARAVAHEFKNPLTPIKLSAERLRKKFMDKAPDFSAVFDECSKTIVQEADSLHHLVDEFANFARIPPSNPTMQPIAPVIDAVVQLYSAAHRDIEFRLEIPADLPDVLLDREQMKRVFINLVENSVEAMGSKGVIRISARRSRSNMAEIDFSDEGPGIAPEDVPKLFQPDFSRKKRKSGLGLAIVQRIIKDHGGAIRYDQNMQHGARFVIELPMALSAPHTTSSRA